MAPRELKPRRADGPDGAKPGAEAPRTTADRYAFDADRAASSREAAPVTIGEQAWYRRRKNWEVTRALRRLLRMQEREGGRGERLRAQQDALTEKIRGVRDRRTGEWKTEPLTDEDAIEAVEQQIETIDEQIEAAGDAADLAAYQIVELLLRDRDGGGGPPVEFLREHVDVREIGDMAAMLASGSEPDPTPETPTS